MPEVQNRGISGPTNGHVSNKNMPVADPGFPPGVVLWGGGGGGAPTYHFAKSLHPFRKCMHSHTIDSNTHRAVKIKFIQLS